MDSSPAQRLKDAACAWAAVNLADRSKAPLVAQEVFVQPDNPLRFDVAAYAPSGTTAVFEIKSSLADFSADAKYQHYMRWCHNLYFVFVQGEIPHHRIPSAAGILEATPDYGELSLRRLPQERLSAANPKELLEAIVFSAFFQAKLSVTGVAPAAPAERPRLKYGFREIFGSPFAPHLPQELPDDIEIVPDDQLDPAHKEVAAPSVDEFLNS